MEFNSEIQISTDFSGTIDMTFSPGGQISGQPKILTATYNFVPLTITIKERSDSE